MKKILIIFCTIACGVAAHAQKLQLSLNGGVAIPTGAFAKGSYEDPASGFGKTGGRYELGATYWLGKHWGVNVAGGYSRFGFKGSQSLADGYKEDSGTDSTTLYTKSSNHAWSVLAGPIYRLSAGKSLSFTARVLAGYVHTTLAGFTVYYEDYTENAMSQRSASGGAFGMQGGIGAQYAVTHKIALLANVDYFFSKPDLAIGYDNFVVNSGRKLERYNETLGGIQATIGIAFNIR